jgi:hypothetical protein
MKERALARELSKVLPDTFGKENMQQLIERLKVHDEYR